MNVVGLLYVYMVGYSRLKTKHTLDSPLLFLLTNLKVPKEAPNEDILVQIVNGLVLTDRTQLLSRWPFCERQH